MVLSSDDEGEHGKKDVKSTIHRMLENHWLEMAVLVLLLADIALVSVEAGIDHKALCINGELAEFGSPAGTHLAHHGHGHRSSLLGEGSSLPLPRVVRRRGSALGFQTHLQPGPGSSRMGQMNDQALALGGVFLQLPELRGATIVQDQSTQHGSGEKVHHAQQPKPSPAENVRSLEGHNARANDYHNAAPDDVPHKAGSDDRGSHRESDHHGHHSIGQESDHEDRSASVNEHHTSGSDNVATAGGHQSGADEPDVLICEGPQGHTVHHVVHTCHSWSVAILCVFAAELLLKIWVIPGFLQDPFHKLDCAVVFLSLLLDTVVMWLIDQMKKDQAARDKSRREIDLVAALLLLSRAWRVVRIVHGLYEFGNKESEVKHKLGKAGSDLGEEKA